MHVLITRPRDQALELADRLAARGDTALIEPLLTIARIAGRAAAGWRAGAGPDQHECGARPGPWAGQLPLFAVGAATAGAARRPVAPR